MSSAQTEVATAVDTVIEILVAAEAAEYIGEPVSQLEHGLQAAALAQRAGQPTTVVLAALLHDIGHLIDPSAPAMDGLGVVDHEGLGAHFLRQLGFSDDVCHLVRSHVQGKRYLCYRKAGYYDALSPASRGTLEWQGGPMDGDEARAFEADPWFETILRMRVFDDRAKSTEASVPPLESYRPLIEAHLHQNQTEEIRPC